MGYQIPTGTKVVVKRQGQPERIGWVYGNGDGYIKVRYDNEPTSWNTDYDAIYCESFLPSEVYPVKPD